MSKKHFLIINAILLVYLVVITSTFLIGVNYETLSFAVDAKEYLSVRNEFFDFEATGASNIRPFLYPLFLKVFMSIGGVKAVWIAQLGLWLISANFIFYSIRRISKGYILPGIAVILFISNISLIALTYHALTEVITAFFLSWCIFILTNKNKDVKWMLKIMAIAVALVLIKPLFIYPTLAILVIGVICYFRKFIKSPRAILLFVLIMAPLAFQYSVMKIKYRKWELSQISGITIRNYIVAQGYERIEGLSRDESLIKANNLSESELKQRVKDHYDHYKQYFFENVEQNVAGEPYFLMLKKEWKKKYYYYQYSLNKKYWRWIDVLIILSIVILVHQLLARNFRSNWYYFAPFALLLYIVYTSGISFYQGDRLTICALPLGVFALVYPINYAISQYKLRKKAVVS